MSTSRKRNNIAIAGRLTAVTLSVALLAGCTGARFMMGGDPAPVTPTGVTPSANQPVALVNIAGKASLSGVPLANATVKVFDALTNAPAAVISAGGGNVISAGGGNFVVLQTGGRPPLQVAGQTFTTDAQGNFSLPLGNFKPGMAARIVVTAGGKTVTTMVTGSGKALQSSKKGAYGVAQAGFNLNVDEYTHIANQLLWGYSKLAGGLNPESADDIIDNGIQMVNTTMMGEIEARVSNGDANQFAETDETGRVKDTTALNTFTKNAGLEDKTNTLINTGRESVAKESQNRENVVATVTLTKGDFAGSNITVALNNGQLTFTNEKTGESFTVTLPTPPATEQPTTEQPATEQPTEQPQQEESSAGPDETEQDITNAGAFNPTITTGYAGTTLTVGVTQPAGTDDVAAIFARIPVAGNSLMSGLAAAADGTTIGAGSVTQPAVSLVVEKAAAAASSVTLPPRFASATLSGAVWAGYIKTPGPTGTKVATFQIFTVGSYHYLVTKYMLTDAVTTNGGHTTTFTTSALTTKAAGAQAEITLVSRKGNMVNATKTL